MIISAFHAVFIGEFHRVIAIISAELKIPASDDFNFGRLADAELSGIAAVTVGVFQGLIRFDSPCEASEFYVILVYGALVVLRKRSKFSGEGKAGRSEISEPSIDSVFVISPRDFFPLVEGRIGRGFFGDVVPVRVPRALRRVAKGSIRIEREERRPRHELRAVFVEGKTVLCELNFLVAEPRGVDGVAKNLIVDDTVALSLRRQTDLIANETQRARTPIEMVFRV